MNQTLEVVPAYGRDYKSQAEVKADWEANMDFKIVASYTETLAPPMFEYGRYINKQDADRELNMRVLVRYAKLAELHGYTKVMAVTS
tara:strand:- start:29 stop:289 length:261 start_codon:yes stop_codon:yes gene_type:complete